LLASERLDPDPLERLNATMQLGFSVIASQLATMAAGEVVDIPPRFFDPTSKAKATKPANVQTVGPNQMARLLGAEISS
jgi:hypothetical protein